MIIKKVINKEMSKLNNISKNVRRASHNLDGSPANSWFTFNTAVNKIINKPAWTDVNGDDVTDLVREDIVDNYGLEDTSQAINNIQSDIKEEKRALKHSPTVAKHDLQNHLYDSQNSLKSLENNVHDDWAENHGFIDKYVTNNYYTDITAKSILAWIKDVKNILKGDIQACAEA